jgi:hypothetical protein
MVVVYMLAAKILSGKIIFKFPQTHSFLLIHLITPNIYLLQL